MKRIFFCLLLFVQSAFAYHLTIEQKLDDLNQTISMIKAGYAPIEYKSKRFNIDINTLHKKYIRKVNATKTNADFYYTINQLIAEFHDSHFRAMIPTDYMANLGFTTDFIEGKAVIYHIDRQVLSKKQFPFKKGDEIVSMDGMPAEKLISKLYQYKGSGSPLTDKRQGAFFLTTRQGMLMPVPTGKVQLDIRSQQNPEAIQTVQLEWKTSGTPMQDSDFHADDTLITKPFSFEDRRNLTTDPENSISADPEFDPLYCSGKTRIKIPKDAHKLIDEPFTAYYHPHPTDKRLNIGYIRLPHFNPVREGGGDEQYQII